MIIEKGIRIENEEIRWDDPKVIMKPHHFSSMFVRNALTGNGEPYKLAAELYKGYEKSSKDFEELEWYFEDVLGKKPFDSQAVIPAWTAYFTQLQDMQDHDVVHLDLALDGMCNGCIHKRHCLGTNLLHGATNYALNEHKNILSIVTLLQGVGYMEKIDYRYQVTQHTLYDYQGLPIDANHHPSPIKVEFASLLATAKALRSIA